MNIITPQLKELFNQSIDALLAQNALSSPCTLKFNNSITEVCNNCHFDSLSKTSSAIYNGTGPNPFINGTICPVCIGLGMKQSNSTTYQTVLAVIFDSKYFLNISNRVINIPDKTIQTICGMDKLHYINNCNELIVDSIPNQSYERFEDPTPCGFGNQDYIIVMWKQK